ncbi:serine/threonine-protein phosphatase 2A activator 1 [Coprinellus micaceus]|uniref:Serine/threonine-protein phosphatase 2A activator n=1 Tax=Coprinellus micaceus TaxID=71717 RepID=A0A4Y7TCB4_COPMI|nr:serine/threonine-protein phosphatase 2A activator 1 [Coprinellus micaceus]
MTELRRISLDQVQSIPDDPIYHIKTDEDVQLWKTTHSYKDYSIFLNRLTNAVVNYHLPWSPEALARGTMKTLALLDKLEQWIEEIPPLQTPQRFGNLAFRTWGKRLEENCDALLGELLEPECTPVRRFAKPYLMGSFGSFTRMDYGTGHETSFALFLLVLTLVRFFEPVPQVERELVLIVFLRYLRLCWKLQDVYRLEPAGSHGVWGLDDSHFLPYIFGSGQLRDQADVPVNAVLRTPLPGTNLYFLSISRIHQVKNGPFHEHSSSLHAIAVSVPNWGKVNSGLFKMYEAEVLSKRVVVQHIPLGGILEWDSSPLPASDSTTQHRQAPQYLPHPSAPLALPPATSSTPRARSGLGRSSATTSLGTQAPWATSTPPGGGLRSASHSRPVPGAAMLPPTSFPRRSTDDRSLGS